MNLIQKGSTGSDVKKWQNFLYDKKYDVGSVDGKFGGRTRAATIRFQQDNNLIADGIVGKLTIQKAEGLGFPKQKTYKRNVTEIIIHITASNDNATVEAIRNGHLARGFSDIGYHWLIDRKGNVLKGRNEDIIGSHVAGHNTDTIGISYIARGNDIDWNGKYGKYMTDLQKKALEKKIAELITQYGLTIYDVSGHNDYAGKACPCFKVSSSTELLEGIKKFL